MTTLENGLLKENDIQAPSILVIIPEEDPAKRILFFATRKRKGNITDAFYVLGLPVVEIPTNRSAAKQESEGERYYLPNANGGKDKRVKQYELPTDEELLACRNIFEQNENIFGETFPALMNTVFGE